MPIDYLYYRGKSRAAWDWYQPTFVPPPDVIQPMPFSPSLRRSWTNYFYYWTRTAYREYWIDSKNPDLLGLPIPIELGQMPRPVERAPGAPRAAASAYWIGLLPVEYTLGPNIDPSLANRSVVADPQRQPLRAANEAYWHQNWVPPPDVTDNLELPRTLPPVRLPVPRAAAVAYDILDTLAVFRILITPPSARGFQQVHFLIPRRSANTAYGGFTLPQVPQVIDVVDSVLRRIIPDLAPGPRRAAVDSYWIPANLVDIYAPPPTPLPIEIRSRILPETAPGPRRAAAAAYWLPPNLVDILAPSLSATVLSRVIPERAPGYPRAGAEAYEIEPNLVSLYAPPGVLVHQTITAGDALAQDVEAMDLIGMVFLAEPVEPPAP